MMHRATNTTKSKADGAVRANGLVLQPGISVEVVRSQSTAPRNATVGGILRIYDDLYGLTVKHAFLPPAITGTWEDSDDEFAFFDPSEVSQESDEENTAVELRSEGSIAIYSPLSETCLTYLGSIFSASSQSQPSKQMARSIQKSPKPSRTPSGTAFLGTLGGLLARSEGNTPPLQRCSPF